MEIKNTKLFINGAFCDASDKQTFETVNPATGEAIAEISEANKKDIDAAVGAARNALEKGKWAAMSASRRGKIVWKIGDLMKKHIDEFAHLETVDSGKPIGESKNIDLRVAIDVFHYYGGAATKIQGETIPVSGNCFNYTLREPVGVIGLITPWNFPVILAARKMAAALAAGNTVVLKPAEQTPLTALKLAEICAEAGVPEGVVNVVPGFGKIAGAELVAHPGVDGIAFTGSTSVGQQIMRTAADTMKKISLELGGKSPNIVFADSDLDYTVKMAAAAIFYNKGEVCTAGSRLLIEESVHDEFVDKLAARAAKMMPGDPMDEKTRMGPLVSEAQLNKVKSYVEAGSKEGASLVAGGETVDIGNGGKGYFYKPTVFTGVNNKMKIATDEIFGPVLSVLKFKDFDDAVHQANDTYYGLASGIWTRDIKKAHTLARKIKAGTVWINTYNMYDAAAPYGGYKMSGFTRECGMEALTEFYTNVKNVWVDLN